MEHRRGLVCSPIPANVSVTVFSRDGTKGVSEIGFFILLKLACLIKGLPPSCTPATYAISGTVCATRYMLLRLERAHSPARFLRYFAMLPQNIML